VWQLDTWDLGKTNGPGDKVTLGPELLGNKGYGRNASMGKLYAVTHGAGGAATSMAVGSHNCLTLAYHIVEHLIRDHRRRIVLVVTRKAGLWEMGSQSLLNGIEERLGIREPVGYEADRDRPCSGIDA